MNDKMFKKTCLSIAIATGLAFSSLAQAVQSNGLVRALDAYQDGEYRRAAKLLKPFARQGDTTAQIHLGALYEAGLGVKRDEYQAASWYRRAASKGDADAQFKLGLMYMSGDGVTADDEQALKWLERSANQGHQQASFVYNNMLNDEGLLMGC